MPILLVRPLIHDLLIVGIMPIIQVCLTDEPQADALRRLSLVPL